MLCWSTPLGVTRKGNKYDNKILLEQFEKWNTVNLTHIKTHNKYFLAQRVTSARSTDPAYDCKEVREKIKEINYKPIIFQNKRNIKEEKEIYKKRLKVENIFKPLEVK